MTAIQASVLAASLLFTHAALAATNTYCGKKGASEGASYLEDDKGKVVLALGDQEDGEELLKEANKLIKGGMKEGEAYCVTVMTNAGGTPVKVIKAKPDLLTMNKKTLVPVAAPTGKPMPTQDDKKTQTLKEVKTPGTAPAPKVVPVTE